MNLIINEADDAGVAVKSQRFFCVLICSELKNSPMADPQEV